MTASTMSNERAPKGSTVRAIAMMSPEQKELLKNYANALGVSLSNLLTTLAVEQAQEQSEMIEAYKTLQAGRDAHKG